MAVEFRQVSFAPLQEFSASAPDGVIVGIIGENGAGKRELLHLAAGTQQPASGSVLAAGTRRLLGPMDALNLAPVGVLALEHTLCRHDGLVRARAGIGLERLKRAGAAILLLTHEEDLVRRLADEVWWIQAGRLARKGDPDEILKAYHRHIARQVRAWGENATVALAPSMRRGDGRAVVVSIETLGESEQPTSVWRSGEPACVRVTVRFEQEVEDPVVGVMIRTRIGFEVYGTNTELEGVKLGPCAAGEVVRVSFAFCCDLCPQEYTLTAASHDPDGVWHDWLEDAVALTVTGARYTAGVANLKAQVTAEKP